jgi:hypothetical protein
MTDFDPKTAVARYRRVIAQFETEPSVMGQHELRTMAMRLREHWKDCKGGDSLHETAFGKPMVVTSPAASVPCDSHK